MINQTTNDDNILIANWLVIVSIFILLMVALGGYTRLSGAGLSMVEWKPITNIIPPLTEAAWQEEFLKYQTSPEFKIVNNHMNLAEFKFIYNLEFYHRLLGRIVGFVFFLPFAYFIYQRKISKNLFLKLLAILLLGAVQGFVGWYMVKSGLKDQPYVNQFRLAFHLLMALLLYSLILWQAYNCYYSVHFKANLKSTAFKLSLLIIIILVVQIFSGALVAGTKAGFLYNDFPYMNGEFLPGQLYQPNFWESSAENTLTIQFNHRIFALITILAIYGFSVYIAKNLNFKKLAIILTLLISAQVLLGVSTLIHIVPINLAVIHQLMAFILMAVVLNINHRIIYNSKIS